MKKKLQKVLAPNGEMFYVLFLLFAVVRTLFLSRVRCGGYSGVRHTPACFAAYESERQRQVQDLMDNIEVSGGEISRR